MLALAMAVGPSVTIMQSVLAGPGRADFARRGVPERRMRLLQRPQRDRHVRYRGSGCP